MKIKSLRTIAAVVLLSMFGAFGCITSNQTTTSMTGVQDMYMTGWQQSVGTDCIRMQGTLAWAMINGGGNWRDLTPRIAKSTTALATFDGVTAQHTGQEVFQYFQNHTNNTMLSLVTPLNNVIGNGIQAVDTTLTWTIGTNAGLLPGDIMLTSTLGGGFGHFVTIINTRVSINGKMVNSTVEQLPNGELILRNVRYYNSFSDTWVGGIPSGIMVGDLPIRGSHVIRVQRAGTNLRKITNGI